MRSNWFDLDVKGIERMAEARPATSAFAELLSNAWDASPTKVTVSLVLTPGRPTVTLSVSDNGKGFEKLSDAWTVMGDSSRAGDSDARGRFCIGEKLALARCLEASIHTTSGTVMFQRDGTRSVSVSRVKEQGTTVTALLKMTREEVVAVDDWARTLIPPVSTSYNGSMIPSPVRLDRISAKLPTPVLVPGEDAAVVRQRVRETTVDVYAAANGVGMIYEMGIPVVETDIPYWINVGQKVPLGVERDNVPPAYSRTLKALVLNARAMQIPDAAAPWVTEAMASDLVEDSVIGDVIARRFGQNAVIATPGAPVSNAMAEANGYPVVHGGSLPSDVWRRVRAAGVMQSTATVFPTASPAKLAADAAAAVTCPMCGK